MIKKLNRTTASLPQQRKVKVLQFGGGNFLRAFADWIIDVMNEKVGFDGAVQLIQPVHNRKGVITDTQDGLYHVIINGIKTGKPYQETRLITCVDEILNPFENFEVYLKTAENPDLQFILSNTTEAGIMFNAADTNSHTLPESFPGKLTTLLYHRFTFFKGAHDKGLIIMPCELIDKNGEALKKVILHYIDHWKLSDDFKNWIINSNTFCNSLVDRIVPGFPKDTAKELQRATGYEDNLMVMAEPFHLWVIEAPDFVQELFPAHKAGLNVKFVKDMAPYRTSKVRILNGGHTALVPVAYLNGLRTVRDAVEDKATGEYLRNVIFNEIIPTLDLLSKEELHQFAHDVMERFQNPFIRHELMSIALNSISKFKVRVLPSILKYIEVKKQLPEHLTLSLAALIRFYKGEWKGEGIPLNDTPEVLAFFKQAWATNDAAVVVHQTLSNKDFWGIDLTTVDGLEAKLINDLKSL